MDFSEKFRKIAKELYKRMLFVFFICMAIAALLIYYLIDPRFSALQSTEATTEYVVVPEAPTDDPNDPNYDKIENGIHLRTGFVEGEALMLVVNNCTNCHSAKLVTQNRMSKERWMATIRWMQETQNLWDLGENEAPIIDYLATHYAPTKKGRRQNLAELEWYELEK